MRPAGSARGAADAEDAGGRKVLVALDIGTSGARAVAFDLDGVRRLEVRRGYPTDSPRSGWAEQDPGRWRSAGMAALGELVLRLGPRRQVLAIGLTGQCPSVVLLDAAHRPVTPGLIYRDNRATAEAAWLRDTFGAAALHARTGHLPAAFHIAPKLRWLQRHAPDAWQRGALVLQPRDWLALTLTGEAATDGTHAAATLLYDLRSRTWATDLLEAMEIPREWLPPLRASSEVVGGLRAAVAKRLGLRTGIPIVLGGADSQACALGAGVLAPGPVSEMAGSSTCLNAVVLEPLPILQVTHYPHVVGSSYTTETGLNTSGAAVTWLANLLYGGRAGRASSRDYERLDAEARAVAPGSDGLLVIPALGDGERTDPTLRGAVTGLSLRHDRGVIARAVLEGVAYAIREQLELLRAGGAPPTELRISGGDARLATWNQIKADATGLPVRTIPGDAAVTGVAMLAGIGIGAYRDVDEAVIRCVRPGPVIEPDPATRTRYDEASSRYRELVAASV
ncbi:MAG: xylulokinase, partial [Chloroflexota bacterium]|nr:xylulokinase [Chloroflexota bacterium]